MRIKFQNCLFLIYNFIMIDDFDWEIERTKDVLIK
jgi:hypothetical protein